MKTCKLCEIEPRKPGRSAKYCWTCTDNGYPSQSKIATQARKFGISEEDLNSLEASQGGRCAICGQVNPDGRRLAVDHDHSCCPGKESCGKCVRGLLCDRCNRGLGFFDDDPIVLESAATYLNGKKY